MNINIVAVGRMTNGPEKELWDKYYNRLLWPITASEVPDSRAKQKESQLSEEAKSITKVIPKNCLKVALDLKGDMINSISFAGLFEKWMLESQNRVVFIVGGANGLQRKFLSGVDHSLSMGLLTWPHMLARCMLLEQIYSTHCILTNHHYHRK